MSISSFLLTKENLDLVGSRSWKFGRPRIIETGRRYYDEHPEEADRIAANLERMGLPHGGEALDRVIEEILAHYFEKLFVLVKGYEAYWIAKNRIEMGDSLEPFHEAQQDGKAVFVGQSHFGATYLMASALMVNGIDVATVGSFPEPVGTMLEENIERISSQYRTGRARLINVADPGVDVPTEMMVLLKQRRVVSNVYDENNGFCRPVDLLGRKIMGGAGMDRILSGFTDDEIVVVTPFLVRTSEETFRYELDRHSLSAGDIVESFFRSLEKRIRADFEQWYFIHELHANFIDD